MKYAHAILLAAAFLLLAPAAFPQSAGKPLTDREVTKMIADWPAVAQWFKDRSQKLAAAPDGSIPSALFMDKDFTAFIGKRGWTAERFGYVTGTAFSLLSVVAIERQNPDIAKQFDESIAQVEASEMSAADKAEAVKALNDAKAGMLAIPGGKEIDQAELKIIRARYENLMALAEKMRGE